VEPGVEEWSGGGGRAGGSPRGWGVVVVVVRGKEAEGKGREYRGEQSGGEWAGIL
jgi:hypothetical protein